MFQPGSIIGSTFFASKEPVRDPLSLAMVHTGRALASKDSSMEGSMSHRKPGGHLISSDVRFATMAENQILELKDYDPVRKTSMVIGLKEPTVYVPLHWLSMRTHPDHDVSLLLFMKDPPNDIQTFRSTLLHGSFEEAMEVVKAMKASGADSIFLHERGLLLMAKDLKELPNLVRSIKRTVQNRKASGKDTRKGGKTSSTHWA